MYICYNVWFMTKLFFKNPIFMIWVAFCPTYLFFKPNMYIFYLLFMIMIPFKTQYVYMCFSRMVRFLTLSHIFFIRIQVFMTLIIYCFIQCQEFLFYYLHFFFIYTFTTYICYKIVWWFHQTSYLVQGPVSCISFKARYRIYVTQ